MPEIPSADTYLSLSCRSAGYNLFSGVLHADILIDRVRGSLDSIMILAVENRYFQPGLINSISMKCSTCLLGYSSLDLPCSNSQPDLSSADAHEAYFASYISYSFILKPPV